MSRKGGFSASATAHELGHAQELEGSRNPRLRLNLYRYLPLAGAAGGVALSFLLARKGFRGARVGSRTAAGLGGGVALAGEAPRLYEEHRASKNARKGLAAVVSPEDVRKAARTNRLALSTYLTGAAGTALGAASWGVRNRRVSSRLGWAGLGLMVPQALLGMLTTHQDRKGPLLSGQQLQRLKQAMGTKAKVVPTHGPAQYQPARKGGPGTAYVPYVRAKGQ